MIVDRIGREKSYEMYGSYGLKIWDKVISSGTISPGEDIQQAYKELDKILEEAHQQTLSQIEEFRGTKVRDVVEEPVVDSVQASLDEINKCTEMDGEKGLNSLWLISKGNLTLSKAWKEQEKKIKG